MLMATMPTTPARTWARGHGMTPRPGKTSQQCYTRCNGDSFFTIKNDKYAFKKLTDCILVKLLTHYTSGHKRTGLAISKPEVEGAALNKLIQKASLGL